MRVTGGDFRSRPLVAPRGSATRPTSDRVREALFSILQARHAIADASVLDLFAGTGALAFEALSRGASRATVVECARPAIAAIQANVAALGLGDRVRVVPLTVERAVRGAALDGAPFDLVFADPPYKDVPLVIGPVLAELARRGWLAEHATLVVEHAKGDDSPEVPGAVLVDTRRYGDTSVSVYTAETPETKDRA